MEAENAALPPNFHAQWFSKDLPGARGLFVINDKNNIHLDTSEEVGNHILVLRRTHPAGIYSLTDYNLDGVADEEYTQMIASESTLNHGLAVHQNYMYASSDTTVFRWPFVLNEETVSISMSMVQNDTTIEENRTMKVKRIQPQPESKKQIVVKNMNADGRGGAPRGHTTRTLIFDSKGRLYISVGSNDNVDPDSIRSRIRRFDFSKEDDIPDGGYDFMNEGELFADGLRNEVGLAFDFPRQEGNQEEWEEILWGVENGADNLRRRDLGGDIHNDNPAEELNRFPTSLTTATATAATAATAPHYGYPYCFTEYKLLNQAKSPVPILWTWPSFMDDGIHSDEWCCANTKPPALAMQAHSAPLGLTFYNAYTERPSLCDEMNIPPFPESMHGDIFVGFHGSWNRDIPTGYKVVRIPMDATTRMPSVLEPIDFFCHNGTAARWPSGLKPVDVKFDQCHRLLITSDGTRRKRGRPEIDGEGMIIVTYNGDNLNATTKEEGCSASFERDFSCLKCASNGHFRTGGNTFLFSMVLFVRVVQFFFF